MTDASPANVATPIPTPGEQWERSRPEWQAWLNRFCENWIFAVIVAMAVRHFAIEAFRIPTASMEPMLYGDPAVFQSDYVVVDKLWARFRGVHRWDVTVFQFPQPEIREDGNEVTAYDADGERRDNFLTNPLSYRNFVKRAVVLPGDVFYIANGDLFLQRPDGSFSIERKPAAIQEALWQDIYRQGAAGKYAPWEAKGAGVAPQGGLLDLQLPRGGEVRFAQPLRNLYVKPGTVQVRSKLNESDGGQVSVSMTSPQFTTPAGTTGSIWDLDRWNVFRLTSADLDEGSQARGKLINAAATEFIGDVRVRFAVTRLEGSAVLRIAEGDRQRIDLQLTGAGWQLDRDGAVVGQGAAAVLGKTVSLADIDDQAVVAIDGTEVARIDLAANDPQVYRTAISWFGDGGIGLRDLTIQRDVHYCANGFLESDAAAGERFQRDSKIVQQSDSDPDSRLSAAKELRDLRDVRAMMLGKPVDQLTRDESYRRTGYSPETAVHAPAGAYLMLGDNSTFSWDGRSWGWVPAANLRGRVLAVVLWPQRWHVVR